MKKIESGFKSKIPVEDLSSDELIPDATCDEIPDITHSIIFKCIGVLKKYRYKKTLETAARNHEEKQSQYDSLRNHIIQLMSRQ